MKSINTFRQLSYLKDTVQSTYGKGAKAWFTYFYYGLLRINKFRILLASLEDRSFQVCIPPYASFFIQTPKELDAIRSQDNLPREFFCDRLHKVSNCCLGKFDGEIAYIHWIYRKGDYSRFLNIGSDAAEINYLINLPKFRGHGMTTAALHFTMHTLQQEGIKKLYAVIHDENVACLKSFKRAGFVDIGTSFAFGRFNGKLSV